MIGLATPPGERYRYARMISDHASEWIGLPVDLYKPDTTPNYAHRISRLAIEYDDDLTFPELFERFISNPACAATKAIIIGAYAGDDPSAGSEEIVQLLVAARTKLPNLRGIFLGDIIGEENEISWIMQSDVTPLFEAYPALEHFRVRGSNDLSFGSGIEHAHLKSLVVESGGLDPEIIRAIAASKLLALEHLEIWTGDSGYGGDSTVADLAPFLDGSAWPKLKSLGLRDSEYADDIAEMLLSANVIGKLDALDLSLGVLGDRGGEALLKNMGLRRLKKLDLSHHYFSDQMVEDLKEAFPHADLSDGQGDAEEDDRYVAVSE